MTTHEITCGEIHLRVEFRDGVGQTEPGIRHSILGEPHYGVSFSATVTAGVGAHDHWTVRITAHGFGSSDNPHSLVCLSAGLILLVGPYTLCLDITSGTMLWEHRLDEGGVFGIYPTPGEDALVAHTETSVQKRSSAGEVMWTMWGRDIFTGRFEIGPRGILVTDFYGNIYAVWLDTGESAIIARGPPPYPLTEI